MGGFMVSKSKIEAVIKLYFDASYEGNGEKMAQVFHREAHIYGRSQDGALVDTLKDAFVQRVGAPRPADRPVFPRHEEIISIDFTGEHTAVARVKLRVGNTLYTDVLSFMELEGRWAVIAKVLSGVPFEH